MDLPDCAGCRQRDAIIEELKAKVAALEQQVADLQELVEKQSQRLAELEGRLKINSSNSSQPPSADPPSAPKPPAKPPSGRKPGAQPGHPGHARDRLAADQIVPHVPTRCDHCQSPLPADPPAADPPPRWHQVAELPEMLAVVTEHQAQGRTCPDCGHVTWGQIPAEMLAHGFGPKLTATIAFLSGFGHASKRTIEEVVKTLFGVPMSLGSVSNAEAEVSAALEQPYAQAAAAVSAAAVKNADETGWSKSGKLCWLWMAVTAGAALFKICTGRGRAALAALLGESIRGTVGSGRWTAYGIIDLLHRQVCWADLKRDFQKWVDWGGEAVAIGQAGLGAVERLFATWRDFRFWKRGVGPSGAAGRPGAGEP